MLTKQQRRDQKAPPIVEEDGLPELPALTDSALMLILIFMLILMLIFLLMLSSLFVPTLVSVSLEGCADSDIYADAEVVCFTNLGLSCPRGLWLSSYGADDQIEPIQ